MDAPLESVTRPETAPVPDVCAAAATAAIPTSDSNTTMLRVAVLNF
jgi:hypothetical protein